MSFYDDQESDWLANDCKGNIEDYDGAGNYAPRKNAPEPKVKTEAQKARRKRNRQRRRAKAKGQVQTPNA